MAETKDHPTAISGKDKVIIGGALFASILAGVCAHDRFGPVVAFIAAAAALSLLAVVVGHSTEQLGSRMGPGVTGALQSAFGNLPELFVCIFSLKAGLVEVVKGAVIGSILANLLLVLGIALLVGGLKHGTQRFTSEPPKMIATLLLLATAALAVPTLAHDLHTEASKHETTFSGIVAVILLVVFACTMPFFVKGDPAVVEPEAEPHKAIWPMAFALTMLAIAGVGAAFVSEWFVDALVPATKLMGISEAFSGLVIVAIAGNAIENLVGISLALKNKADYAISVILSSSMQIAMAVIPILVLASFFIGPTPLTLVLHPLLLGGLILSTVVTAFIVYDGESIWVEGVALIGLYGIIVAAFWWG